MFKLDIKGKFRDTLRYKSINGITDKVEKRDWKTNQIQDSASEMIATFLAGGNGLFSNYNPIKYLALGAGANNWSDPNNINKPYDATTLLDEVSITNSRVLINASDFTYLGSNNTPLSPQGPSNIIKLEVTIPQNNGIGNLREFGLFGGDAGAGANTGTMINWIDHPLIVKDNHLIIDREIVLTFSLHRS